MHVQTEMPGLPEKPKMPKQYRSFAEAINDPEYPKEKKLSIIAYMCRLETHNGVTKDDLVAMLRWVVNENYDWVLPNPKPFLKVVK